MIVSKKKKIIIGVSVGISVAVALIVIILCLVLLKPNQGKNLEIVDAGQQIFVQAEDAGEDYTYRFKFVQNDNETTFDSSTRTLDLTEKLWNGELKLGLQYKISVCYVDSAGVLSGDYSEEISYTFKLKLASPTISINGSVISWEEVRGADFYTIRYAVGNEILSIETDVTSFDLSKLPGGERTVFVTSGSKSNGLIESDSSNQITTVVNHSYQEFEYAYLDLKTFVLTIVASEKVGAVKIRDNLGNEYIADNLIYESFHAVWNIKIDVKGIYKTGTTLTVQPEEDEFNSFSGKATTVVNQA